MLKDLDNETKPWDGRIQLFHRVDSPRFDKKRDAATGQGYRCGARAPSDFKPSAISNMLANHLIKAVDAILKGALASTPLGALLLGFNSLADEISDGKYSLQALEDALAKLISDSVEGALFGKYMRSLPAWVPVERKGFPKTSGETRTETYDNSDGKEIEHEVEGLLTFSYLTLRAIPYLQWNRWYAWAFHLRPIDGYAYMVGNGNIMTPEEKEDLGDPNDPMEMVTDVNSNYSRKDSFGVGGMACLLDMGAFGVLPGDRDKAHCVQSAIYHDNWPFWPTGGDYFWGVGRWVYDAIHVTSNEKSGNNEGLMPTQLHPLKAFAATRYEGYKFDENEKATPAVRFLFFACKNGGYLDFGDKGKDEQETECGIKFNDRDYSFIVDLPEGHDAVKLKWPIGHTPEFESNTVVLRPTMLVDVKMAPFGIPTGLNSAFFRDNVKFDEALQPKIELLEPQDPKAPQRRQVRVTIELSKVAASATAYGCCISLGWFDPTQTLAEKVKRVTLHWRNAKIRNDFDQVRMNFGASGRHRYFFHDKEEPGAGSAEVKELNASIRLYVPDDSSVKLAIHGMNRNGFGESMEENPAVNESRMEHDRTLRMGGIAGLSQALQNAIATGDTIVTTIFGDFNTEFLKDLHKNVLDILQGERRVVDWKKHIDQEDHDIAAIVAREMFVKIVPIFSSENHPIGLCDSSSFAQTLQVIGSPDGRSVEMKSCLANMKEDEKEKTFDFDIWTSRLSYVGSADSVARHFNNSDELDVKFSVKVQRQ